MLKLLFHAMLALALVALPKAGAASPATNSDASAISGNVIVARGKGFEIRRHEIDQVLANARIGEAQANAALGKTNAPVELPPDADIRILSQLIELQLVMQQATTVEKAEGMRKTDAKLMDIKKTMGQPKFERQLMDALMTEDDLRLMLFQEDTAQASLTRQLGVNVTDADAKKYFDDNPGAFDQPEKARVRELVLLTTSDFTTSSAPPLPEATVQTKHRQIMALAQRVHAGEDFVALARQYNEDPISKAGDGELSFARDQMEFSDLAFSMKPGQVSDVVTNTEGYRFFQLLEIIPAKKAAFSDIADKLKKMLAGEQKRSRAPAYINQLRKAADVEILDPGLKAKMAANEAEAAEIAKTRAAFEARQAAEATNLPPVKP